LAGQQTKIEVLEGFKDLKQAIKAVGDKRNAKEGLGKRLDMVDTDFDTFDKSESGSANYSSREVTRLREKIEELKKENRKLSTRPAPFHVLKGVGS
jgi:hypothetical protein